RSCTKLANEPTSFGTSRVVNVWPAEPTQSRHEIETSTTASALHELPVTSQGVRSSKSTASGVPTVCGGSTWMLGCVGRCTESTVCASLPWNHQSPAYCAWTT